MLTQSLLHQALDLTMKLLVIGLLGGAGYLGKLIAAHVKNTMVATALTSLTDLSSRLLQVASSQVYAAALVGQKPDLAAIKGSFMTSLQTFGAKALETLVAHGGVSQAAVIAALQAIGDSAHVQLQESLAHATPPAAPSSPIIDMNPNAPKVQ